MENLQFKNGKFKILQVSDAQDMHYVRHSMIKMLNTAYDKLEPDLVLFTGDNVLSNHLLDARIGNRKVKEGFDETYKRMKKSLDFILKPLEKRGIPFAMIFGNHDDMCCMTKEEILQLYRSYKGFVGLSDTYGEGGTGTYNMLICSGDTPKFNLWMLDTAWQNKDEDKCYTGVKRETVEWYISKSNELKAQNSGEPMPSLMFQHIPMPETVNCVEECDKQAENSFKAKDGKYYRLKPEYVNSGRLYEPTPGYSENNGEFEALKAQKDVLAVVYGHHHKNIFDIELESVRMIQTPCASFRCYGNKHRGVRMFEISEENPQNFTTTHYSFFDLCGKIPVNLLSYFIDADELEKPRRAAAAALGITAAGVATGLIIKHFSSKY